VPGERCVDETLTVAAFQGGSDGLVGQAADSPEEKKQENARQMLDAHQALCDAAPQNFPRFKDVLDYLKQDLHHGTAPH
jgi:hypothetical protein